MDAFELLKNDHEKVSDLFSQIESASGKTKTQLFSQLKAELDLHAHIEETILYPALENTDEAREITLEAYEEHKVVKDLLAELASAGSPNDEWDAKLTVLKENVEHHVEEEEGELFDKAREALGESRIEQLGTEMEAEKAAKSGRKATAPTSRAAKAPAAKAKQAKKESPGVLQRLANLVGLGDGPSTASDKRATRAATRSSKASAATTKSRSGSKTISASKGTSKTASTQARAGKPAPKAAAKKNSGKKRRSSKTTTSSKKKSSTTSRAGATKSVARAASNQRVKTRGARRSQATKSSTKSRRKSR